MSLPPVDLPRDKISVAGHHIEVRGLTRHEASMVKEHDGDVDRMEILILAYGTDTTEDEAAEWWNHIPAGVVEPILDAILRLSGLGPGAQKSSRTEVPQG